MKIQPTGRPFYFYSEKASHLKITDPRRWWSFVNKLAGKSNGTSVISYEVDNKVMAGLELANRLKNFFVSVTSVLPTLDYLTLPAFLPHRTSYLSPPHGSLQKKNAQRKSFQKACCPDANPNRILKLFASELSEPVIVIFN